MRQRFGAAVLVALGAGLLSPVLAQETAETAIRARVKEYVAAYNRGDAKGIAALYLEDGTHTYALGFTHRGRLEIARGLGDLLAGSWKGTKIEITPERIRLIDESVAVEEATFLLSGLNPGAGAQADVKGLCLGVYQKREQRWFAAAVQCMVPPPLPAR
jgi:uncharacterized protein (TIGR02246 family)